MLVVALIVAAMMSIHSARAGASPTAGNTDARAAAPAAPLDDAGLRTVEADLAYLVNQRRVEAGLQPLLFVDSIRETARAWSRHLADLGQLQHRSDLSVYPAAEPAVTWVLAGENVGRTGSFVASHVQATSDLDQAFFDSPRHRDNVLGAYNHISVGAYDDGSELWVTLAFVDFDGEIDGSYLPDSRLHDASMGALYTGFGGDRLRLSGRAVDPDGPDVRVDVTVNGAPASVAVTDADGRFSTVAQVSRGVSQVCATARNVRFGHDSAPMCRRVVTYPRLFAARGNALTLLGPGDDGLASEAHSVLRNVDRLAGGSTHSRYVTGPADTATGETIYRIDRSRDLVNAVPVAHVDGRGMLEMSDAQAAAKDTVVATVGIDQRLVSAVLVQGAFGPELSGFTRSPDGALHAFGAVAALFAPVEKAWPADIDPTAISTRAGLVLAGRDRSAGLVVLDAAATVHRTRFAPAPTARVALQFADADDDGNDDLSVVVQGKTTNRASVMVFAAGSGWNQVLARSALPSIGGGGQIYAGFVG